MTTESTTGRSAQPVPFDARAIGEQVLARIAEIEHLRSPERAAYHHQQAKRTYDYDVNDHKQEDARRADRLSEHLGLLTQLAAVAAQREHVDRQTRQATRTNSRRDVDEF